MGLAEPEVDFPRGGAPTVGKTSQHKAAPKRKNEDALFGDGTKKTKTAEKHGKKSKEEKEKSKKPDVWTKAMTLDLLIEGVLGVGVVREIEDDHIILETSDNCKVYLPANQIGKQFTELLKSEKISTEDVFSVGQMVPFRVTARSAKSVKQGKQFKQFPNVTCDPSKLNSHLVPSQLVSGLVIHSIVESLEEKGYVLDIGLQSAKGFLPLDKAPPAASFLIGQPLLIRIESTTSRIVKVSAFVEQDTLSAEACEKLKLNQLMPGTIIECDPIIEEQNAGGIYVTLGNGIRAFVARRHLPPRLRADTSRLVKSFRSVVMFCQQNSNLLVLSAHPHIVAISKPEKRRTFDGVEVGDTVVCTVMDVVPSKFHVTFLLPISADGKTSLVTASASKAYLHKAEECEKYYQIGSEHECRVVDVRYAERCLIVATRKDILKQKMVSYRDAVPGEMVKATVVKPNASGVNVKIFGTIRGFMPLHLISDKAVSIEKMYPVDKEFTCRIFNVDMERKQVTVTAKPSILKHTGTKVNSYSEEFVGKTAVGIVSKVFPTGALLVVFFNGILGVLPAAEAKKLGTKAAKDKSVHVKIGSVDVENRKMQLLVVEEDVKQEDDEQEQTKEEKPAAATRKETKQKALESTEKPASTKTVKRVEAEAEEEPSSKKSIKNFKLYTARVVGAWDSKEADSHFCVKVKLPGDNLGRLHVSEFPSRYFAEKDIIGAFLKKNQHKRVTVKVIGYSTVHKGAHEKRRLVDVTMAETKLVESRVREKILGFAHNYKKGETVRCFVADSNKTASVRVEISPIALGSFPREKLTHDMVENVATEGGLTDIELRKCSIKMGVVTDALRKKGKIHLKLDPVEDTPEDSKLKEAGDFEMGRVVTGRIITINQTNIGVAVLLSTGQQAILGPTGISEKYEKVHEHVKKFNKGELYRFYALRRDEEPRRYHIITEGRYKQHQKDPESREATALLTSLSDVVERKGETVSGFLCFNSGDDFALVEIGPGLRASIKKNNIIKKLPLNAVIAVKIKDVDEEKRKIYVSYESVVFNPTKQVKKEVEETAKPVLKRKADISLLTSTEKGEKIEVEDPGFDWDNVGFTPDELASVGKIDSDVLKSTNREEEPVMKKAKKTTIEKEKELSAKEALLNSDELLESDEDFDRLLRKDPNSAAVWIRYMSHFLQQDDLDKARATAERALTAIGYREEAELFNLWTAYLNMEVAYGDADSVKTIFDRACGNADSLKVHKRMAAIFIANDKVEEADEIFNAMIRKFRASSDDVWFLYADHLMSTERAQEGRDLLQRALASVPKIRHAQLICRFAQLEYQKGDAERGRTLFESLITAYPKKTDLWMVYADLSLKFNGIETARQVLERACSLSLNLHKLRPLFKKWMEFEEKHGDEKSMQLVRSHAQRFLQSNDVDE